MWTTRVTVVDIDTGEIITSPSEIENYIIDKSLTQKNTNMAKKGTLLSLQSSENEIDNKELSFEERTIVKDVKDTQFKAIKDSTGKWKLVLGKYLAHRDGFETYEKLVEYVEKKPWELIIVTNLIILRNEQKG